MSAVIQELNALVDAFKAGESTYLSSSGYTEAETRLEFIDKMFVLLGWDINNNLMLHPSKREVVIEQTNQSSKRPDYMFRVEGVPQFYVEAKKPAVDIRFDTDAIFQARRYGYTDEHAIVALTNFRHLSIYDSSIPVDEQLDCPETGLLFSCECIEYADEFSTISRYLSRSAVGTDEWKELVVAHNPVHYIPAGKQFLQHLRRWRSELGSSIVANNPSIDETELNDIVQLIINRFLFIRMCEDRGLELEEELRNAAANDVVSVGDLFAKMDRRYNTGLFKQSSQKTNPLSVVEGSTLLQIIDRLYAPASPFSYAVLDADFLGLVYEQSLSEVLCITESSAQGKMVSLQLKSEFAHRDVVTTPQFLVTSVIEKTFEELPTQILHPKVLDFATGSGRFLVSAYRKLVDDAVEARLANKQFGKLIKRGSDDYGLPFADKVAIVTNQLYGIDIDYNAVEVARFSLLVALLEDETLDTLPKGVSILPDLSLNIIHGNSLVRPSRTNPEWMDEPLCAIDLDEVGFIEFDVIVGNPPYVATEAMRKINHTEFTILENSYSTLTRQWDKYFAFVEFGISKLSDDGVIGVVIPNKWMTVVSGSLFRQVLDEDVHVNWLQNYTCHSVFEDKQIYVCGLVAAKHCKPVIEYSEPSAIGDRLSLSRMHRLNREVWLPDNRSDPWVLPADSEQEKILSAILDNSIPLGNIVEARNGLQTSANDVFLIKNYEVNANRTITFTSKCRGDAVARRWTIERDLLIPYLDDSKGVLSFTYVESDAFLLFPYITDMSRSSGKVLISEDVLKQDFPLTYKYLLSCKARLLQRDKGAQRQMRDSGGFYAYGRGQALGYATQKPKIFYSVNQRGDKYGLDNQGIAFQSGGTAGEVALFPRDSGYGLDFVLGLLAQPYIEMFLRKRGSPFRGGFFARGTDVITSVPVPALDFTDSNDRAFHDVIVAKVCNLRELTLSLSNSSQRQRDIIERKIKLEEAALQGVFLRRWGLS